MNNQQSHGGDEILPVHKLMQILVVVNKMHREGKTSDHRYAKLVELLKHHMAAQGLSVQTLQAMLAQAASARSQSSNFQRAAVVNQGMSSTSGERSYQGMSGQTLSSQGLVGQGMTGSQAMAKQGVSGQSMNSQILAGLANSGNQAGMSQGLSSPGLTIRRTFNTSMNSPPPQSLSSSRGSNNGNSSQTPVDWKTMQSTGNGRGDFSGNAGSPSLPPGKPNTTAALPAWSTPSTSTASSTAAALPAQGNLSDQEYVRRLMMRQQMLRGYGFTHEQKQQFKMQLSAFQSLNKKEPVKKELLDNFRTNIQQLHPQAQLQLRQHIQQQAIHVHQAQQQQAQQQAQLKRRLQEEAMRKAQLQMQLQQQHLAQKRPSAGAPALGTLATNPAVVPIEDFGLATMRTGRAGPDALRLSTGSLRSSSRKPRPLTVEELFKVAPPIPLGSEKVSPVDLGTIILERDRQVTLRQDLKRRRLLEDVQKAAAQGNERQKLQVEIEIRSMKLLDLQRQIRGKLDRTNAATAPTSNQRLRRAIKRHDNLSPEELRRIEARLVKQRQFCEEVLKHQKAFKEAAQARSNERKKTARLAQHHVQRIERRKQLEAERQEKERLKALKENNEEEYLRLLAQTKNRRLQQLLQQTDEYLASIGAKVVAERNKLTESVGGNVDALLKGGLDDAEEVKPVPGDQAMDQNAIEQLKKNQQNYYTLTHAKEEEVTEQPEMLIGGSLKSYQLEGLRWMVSLYNNNLNGILADEMGLGKTIQTIALVAYLMETKNVNGPYLVMVPLSVLSNWKLEFERWAPKVNVVVYIGTKAERREIFNRDVAPGTFNVCLTSYESTLNDKAYLSKLRWMYIIIDEGHRIKNHQCNLNRVLAKYYISRNRMLLTGTPLQNSLSELWSLLNFLLPTVFQSCDEFTKWFNAPFAAAGENVEMTEEETILVVRRLHKVLAPFLLRRMKRDVQDQLPDKVEHIIRCGMSAWQKKLYESVQERGSIPSEEKAQQKQHYRAMMNRFMEMRKICNHPFLFCDNYTINENIIRASGKVDLLDDILEKLKATGHRVLIFSQFKELITILCDYFELRGHKYLSLDGSTKQSDRADMLQQFNEQDSEYFVFVLSTRAGGLGLNLQSADTVIIFDSDWNPQMDLQAQDRAHRIGQTSEVRVLRIITEKSVEEDILDVAQSKLNIEQKVIGAGLFNQNATDTDRRTLLERIVKQHEREDREGRDKHSSEQINRMIGRTDEEVILFDQMDEERAGKIKKEGKTRLMTEDELPEWMTRSYSDESARPLEYGRGMREHAEVEYTDGLTERQFVRMLNGEEVKKRGRRKKKPKPDPEEEEEGEEGESDEEDREPRSKKDTYRRVWQRLSFSCDEDGRHRINMFRHLPPRKKYPFYYEEIEKPIDMTMIRKRIEKSHYDSIQELGADFELMFENAKRFNDDESEIFDDAEFLLTMSKDLIEEYGSVVVDLPTDDDEEDLSGETADSRQSSEIENSNDEDGSDESNDEGIEDDDEFEYSAPRKRGRPPAVPKRGRGRPPTSGRGRGKGAGKSTRARGARGKGRGRGRPRKPPEVETPSEKRGRKRKKTEEPEMDADVDAEANSGRRTRRRRA